MAYVQKELSGSLFKNERKESDSHPNMTGTALIDGVEYWVSAWTKEGTKGHWQSLSFKRKEAKGTGGSQPERKPNEQKRPTDDLESDIPF